MQDILEQYQHITENDDIFTFWEQELSLRTALRQPLSLLGRTQV
jgi:hypothetical protein